MPRPTWLIQQLLPPALLTYFFWACKVATFEIGPLYIGHELQLPVLGYLYSIFAATAIPTIAVLYLRLYFLPRGQCVPPVEPPVSIRAKQVIFECPPPSTNGQHAESTTTDDGADTIAALWNRCHKGRCGGRWKPARARHCSDCGVCRAGFDHHCAFFANCLTAPYIPCFLALLTLTPIIVLLLAAPILHPLVLRGTEAYRLSKRDKRGWYDWPLSWIVAGGPMGRYAAGIYLGWAELDVRDPRPQVRVGIGIMVLTGLLLSAICVGLASTTIVLVRSGQLTIDRERARSYARTLAEAARRRAAGKEVPESLLRNLEGWSEKKYFFIPDDLGGAGQVVVTQEGERAYDHGSKQNWEMVMGHGAGWLLPWRALRSGPAQDIVWNWPVASAVEARLKSMSTSRPVQA